MIISQLLVKHLKGCRVAFSRFSRKIVRTGVWAKTLRVRPNICKANVLGPIAQLVEQRFCKAKVRSSNLLRSTPGN